LEQAIRPASDFGKGVACTLMILGIIQMFSNMLVGGVWLILKTQVLLGLIMQKCILRYADFKQMFPS